MKILIDMNLSPDWVPVLEAAGFETVHWSTVGDPRASDRAILGWALTNGYIIFTNDLDFGAILAATQAEAPSVIQMRGQDVLPASIIPLPFLLSISTRGSNNVSSISSFTFGSTWHARQFAGSIGESIPMNSLYRHN